MKAHAVHLGHDVEEEGVRVVVQCLVVQEQLGQQAQMLRVRLQHDGIGKKQKTNEKETVQTRKHNTIELRQLTANGAW